MTIRCALGRSSRPEIFAGFPFGTTRTGSLRAKTLASCASFCARSACMCFWSAEAKTSAGAPFSICVRSSWEPVRLKSTLVPGCWASNCLPSSANDSRSEEAAKTVSSCDACARADSAMPAISTAALSQDARMRAMSRTPDMVSTGGDLLHVQLRHHLAGVARVVSAEARELAAEGPALPGFPDPSCPRVRAPLLGEDEVEALFGERNEIEPMGNGGAPGDDAGVGSAHRHRLGDLQMAMEEVLVALHGGGGHAGLAQQAVEKPSRSRAGLAVHEPDLRPGDVLRLADPPRISLGDGEALFQVSEGHHHHRAATERAPHERKVVLARLFVEEVSTGDVRVPHAEHLEGGVASHRNPAQALPGPPILDVPG